MYRRRNIYKINKNWVLFIFALSLSLKSHPPSSVLTNMIEHILSCSRRVLEETKFNGTQTHTVLPCSDWDKWVGEKHCQEQRQQIGKKKGWWWIDDRQAEDDMKWSFPPIISRKKNIWAPNANWYGYKIQTTNQDPFIKEISKLLHTKKLDLDVLIMSLMTSLLLSAWKQIKVFSVLMKPDHFLGLSLTQSCTKFVIHVSPFC